VDGEVVVCGITIGRRVDPGFFQRAYTLYQVEYSVSGASPDAREVRPTSACAHLSPPGNRHPNSIERPLHGLLSPARVPRLR
jgi:hypothetical protein